MRREILWSRCVRFRLALFEFVVRLDFFGFAGYRRREAHCLVRDVAEIVVLIVMHFVVMHFVVMLFTVLFVMSFGVSFMIVLVVMFFVLLQFRGVAFAALADGFAGQNFCDNRRRRLCRPMTVRIAVPMAMIVIFEIFENVADVQEGVAVETDIDEGGLHTGENAGDAALVDATDQRELFFALDVDFD